MRYRLPFAEETQHGVFSFLENIPATTYIYAMFVSVIGSALLYLAGRRHTALFIGQWAPTFLSLGLFYKMLRPR